MATSDHPTMSIPASRRELRLFIVAGEHSGDALGGRLMRALNAATRGRIRYLGVGGEHMHEQGLLSQFPLSEIAVMGPAAILARLPSLTRKVYRTVDAAIAAEPDAVVIIDSPEFTHPIAKRIRKRRPDIPIIDYVSPSVWAWRPGRAPRMTKYVDHVMALLPFEPEVHRRLGGPPCTYVGHPLVERYDEIAGADPAPLRQSLGIPAAKPVLLVLPGSRRSEVTRLLAPFGRTVARIRVQGADPAVLIPVVDSVRPIVEAAVANWPCDVKLVSGEADKFRAFKLATAALAASGTVTLELGLAGVPMVVAYRVDGAAKLLRFLVKTPSIVLANLVLGENAFPEFIQEECTEDFLAPALARVLGETPERAAQLEALRRIPSLLRLPNGTPSDAAALIVLAYAEHGRAAAAAALQKS